MGAIWLAELDDQDRKELSMHENIVVQEYPDKKMWAIRNKVDGKVYGEFDDRQSSYEFARSFIPPEPEIIWKNVPRDIWRAFENWFIKKSEGERKCILFWMLISTFAIPFIPDKDINPEAVNPLLAMLGGFLKGMLGVVLFPVILVVGASIVVCFVKLFGNFPDDSNKTS